MATKRSKRYRQAAELIEDDKVYSLSEGIDTLKKFPSAKYDETVSISIKLGVDPKQSDQMVRGTCPLPHGSGKQVRVLVFAQGGAQSGGRAPVVRAAPGPGRKFQIFHFYNSEY